MTTVIARQPLVRAVALVASVVVVTVAALPAGRGAAQPFPEVPALTASMVPSDLDPVEIRVDGFRLDPGDPDQPETSPSTVVVSFAEPFALPSSPWRVVVSAGDPNGERVRTTLVSVAGAEPTGRVEEGDGVQWVDAGEAVVATDTASGEVRLALPLDTVDAEAVVWVDAEITQDGDIVGRRTPTVPLVDLRGQRPGPAVGTSSYAEVADGGEPGARPLGAPGPTVQVVGRALELTTTAAAPTSVDGAEVVAVIDSAIVTQATPDGPRTDRIEVDRRTGEVRLAAVGAEPFVAVPGVTPWLVNPPPATAPDSPATVTFDLEALNDAVGGPAFDRSVTQVSADRLLALDDGRILVAAGVAATLAWFDDGLGASAPAAVPVDAAAASSPRGLLMVVAVVLVVLVAGGILARWVAPAEACARRGGRAPTDRAGRCARYRVGLARRSVVARSSSGGLRPAEPEDRTGPPAGRPLVTAGPSVSSCLPGRMPWPRHPWAPPSARSGRACLRRPRPWCRHLRSRRVRVSPSRPSSTPSPPSSPTSMR